MASADTSMRSRGIGPWSQYSSTASSFLAWMRPVHQGSLGAVWKFLVFLSGLVPTLFVVTGVVMWVKKRQRHVPLSEPMPEALEEGEPA